MNADPIQTSILPGIVRATTIRDALQRHYAIQSRREDDAWLTFSELRIGTGYGKDADQRIDFWSMHPWSSKGFRRVAFEIKVSRSDFLREIKEPRKRAYALLWSNEFYFATPPGLVKPGELPPEAGLVEIGQHPGDINPYVHWAVLAPWRDNPAPSWRFFAAVVRRALADGRRA